MAWGWVHFYHIFMFGWSCTSQSTMPAPVHVALFVEVEVCTWHVHKGTLLLPVRSIICVWYCVGFVPVPLCGGCSRWRKIYRTGWREDLHTSNSKLTADLLHLTRITAAPETEVCFSGQNYLCLNILLIIHSVYKLDGGLPLVFLLVFLNRHRRLWSQRLKCWKANY